VPSRQRCPDQAFIQGSSRLAELRRHGKRYDWFTAVNRPARRRGHRLRATTAGQPRPDDLSRMPLPRFTAVNPRLSDGSRRSFRASISRARRVIHTVYRGKPARPTGSSCAGRIRGIAPLSQSMKNADIIDMVPRGQHVQRFSKTEANTTMGLRVLVVYRGKPSPHHRASCSGVGFWCRRNVGLPTRGLPLRHTTPLVYRGKPGEDLVAPVPRWDLRLASCTRIDVARRPARVPRGKVPRDRSRWFGLFGAEGTNLLQMSTSLFRRVRRGLPR